MNGVWIRSFSANVRSFESIKTSKNSAATRHLGWLRDLWDFCGVVWIQKDSPNCFRLFSFWLIVFVNFAKKRSHESLSKLQNKIRFSGILWVPVQLWIYSGILKFENQRIKENQFLFYLQNLNKICSLSFDL